MSTRQTSSTKKLNWKGVVALAIVLVTIVTSYALAAYSIYLGIREIGFKMDSRVAWAIESYTWNPDLQEEKVESAKAEVNLERQAMYESTAYANWFCHLGIGLEILVFALLVLIPTANLYLLCKIK